MENNNIYTRDSIYNILLFGFRNVWKSLLPMTLLSLPFITFYILYGILFLFFFPIEHSHGKPPWLDYTQQLFSLAFVGGFFYLVYVLLRYVRDVSQGQAETRLIRYFIPQRNLLGVTRLVIMGLMIGAYFAIITVIGFFMLILPGVIILLFGLTWFSMIFVTYLAEPEQGIMAAIKQNWHFIKGNFWRTVALGFFIWLAQTIVEVIVLGAILLFFGFAAFFVGHSGGLVHAIIPSMAGAILVWSILTFGLGGTLFILNRYYFDLKARQQQLLPLPIRTDRGER